MNTARGPITVLKAQTIPPQSLYSGQQLEVGNLSATSGYGYLTTRDGTQLSVQVVLPGPPDQGPYPAVMEYSGYDPSSPSTGQPQYKAMLPPSGYAWVGVNIRGTGCSGGAFNFFENLQALDGYDAIETIAAQPWSNGHVGMVGISYAGISQLFVARTQPPHLDAITPVSVIDDTWRGILYPGGILNNGFAVNYANERLEQNKWPNPNAPQWVKDRIANGDDVCADNMLLRGENVDLLDQITKHPNPSSQLDPEFTYDFPGGSDSLAPAEFVRKIKAKVFLAGAVAGRADRRPLGEHDQPVPGRRRSCASRARTACTPSRSTRRWRSTRSSSSTSTSATRRRRSRRRCARSRRRSGARSPASAASSSRPTASPARPTRRRSPRTRPSRR